jgi:hypothetical protein
MSVNKPPTTKRRRPNPPADVPEASVESKNLVAPSIGLGDLLASLPPNADELLRGILGELLEGGAGETRGGLTEQQKEAYQQLVSE